MKKPLNRSLVSLKLNLSEKQQKIKQIVTFSFYFSFNTQAKTKVNVNGIQFNKKEI